MIEGFGVARWRNATHPYPIEKQSGGAGVRRKIPVLI